MDMNLTHRPMEEKEGGGNEGVMGGRDETERTQTTSLLCTAKIPLKWLTEM